MNVKFKGSEIGIVYKVLEDLGPVWEEKLNNYIDCYRLSGLGQVPKFFLEETDEEENATDIMIEIVK